MMKNVCRFSILLAALLFSPTSSPAAPKYVKVATFNIAEFGEGDHPDTRDELAIAKIPVKADLDLIAIPEGGTGDGGEAQVKAITAHMNDQFGNDLNPYDCTISVFETGDERYGFIWRNPVVMTSAIKKMQDRQEYKGSSFVRTPVFCGFRAGDFDFVLMNVHLYTKIMKEGSRTRGRKIEY